MMKAAFLKLTLAAMLALSPVVAHADDDDADVMDRLRGAVERGEARPLSELQRGLRAAFPGEIISVSLDEDDGRFVYEFKVLQQSGRVLEVEIDAASGAVLDVDND